MNSQVDDFEIRAASLDPCIQYRDSGGRMEAELKSGMATRSRGGQLAATGPHTTSYQSFGAILPG
jgi:hypothetical protein